MNRKNLIRHLTKNAEIVLEVEQDDTPVRGNAMASGDDAYDRKVEDGIIARLDRGDVWAWAHVKVLARYDGCEGFDSLGCCEYENEEAFRADGYFKDMRDAAIASLADELIDRQERAEKLAAELKVEPTCDKCGDVGGGAEPGQKCGRVDDGAQQPCDGSYRKGGA